MESLAGDFSDLSQMVLVSIPERLTFFVELFTAALPM